MSSLQPDSVPVTLAGLNLRNGRFQYRICDGQAGVQRNWADVRFSHTLIHEMMHVWQGHNGFYPTKYMFDSAGNQIKAVIDDIAEVREWRGWDAHRGRAYRLAWSDFGRDWSSFNIEQQASIVESWFISERDRRDRNRDFGSQVIGGGESPYDVRYPYISDVIRAGARNAGYSALRLPAGSDADIKRLQDRLVRLGYLEARHADGLVGRSRSATMDAVVRFQARNGLKPDRDLGGANSRTRQFLAAPNAVAAW